LKCDSLICNDSFSPQKNTTESTNGVLNSDGPVEVNEDGLVDICDSFHPTKNDGYALIDNVSTTKGKKLLQDMNLLFPEGSVTAILGPSGAGKSTLLSLLTNSLSSNSNGKADSK
jgi:ABC-type bacteriocin/lantibiotic exporter with double-glycine peptidase domain